MYVDVVFIKITNSIIIFYGFSRSNKPSTIQTLLGTMKMELINGSLSGCAKNFIAHAKQLHLIKAKPMDFPSCYCDIS